jgi:hypothetical protein
LLLNFSHFCIKSIRKNITEFWEIFKKIAKNNPKKLKIGKNHQFGNFFVCAFQGHQNDLKLTSVFSKKVCFYQLAKKHVSKIILICLRSQREKTTFKKMAFLIDKAV